jgi:cell division protein FtsL
MASWSEAAEVAVAPAAPARPQGLPPQPRRKRKQRRGIAGGMAWIAFVGVLLAGIVALNVAVLRLNVRLDRVDTERAKLRAANAALQSQLSSSAASPRIQSLAERRGLVAADPATTTYVVLDRRGR